MKLQSYKNIIVTPVSIAILVIAGLATPTIFASNSLTVQLQQQGSLYYCPANLCNTVLSSSNPHVKKLCKKHKSLPFVEATYGIAKSRTGACLYLNKNFSNSFMVEAIIGEANNFVPHTKNSKWMYNYSKYGYENMCGFTSQNTYNCPFQRKER